MNGLLIDHSPFRSGVKRGVARLPGVFPAAAGHGSVPVRDSKPPAAGQISCAGTEKASGRHMLSCRGEGPPTILRGLPGGPLSPIRTRSRARLKSTSAGPPLGRLATSASRVPPLEKVRVIHRPCIRHPGRTRTAAITTSRSTTTAMTHDRSRNRPPGQGPARDAPVGENPLAPSHGFPRPRERSSSPGRPAEGPLGENHLLPLQEVRGEA